MEKYRVLVLEDNVDMIWTLKLFLSQIGYKEGEICICTKVNQITALKEVPFEIILTDLSLPDSARDQTFESVQRQFLYIPIIVLTGAAEVNTAIKTIQQGAEDYLLKGEFNEKDLQRAIRYAVIRKKISNNYRRLFDDSPAPMYIYDYITFKFLAVNEAALHQYGYTKEEFLSMNAKQIRPKKEIKAFKTENKTVSEFFFDFGRWQHVKKNGEIFFVHIYAHTTEFEGRKARVVLAVDIDKKVKAEIALNEKMSEVENILESITDCFYSVNKNWEFKYINKAYERVLNRKKEDLLGKNIWDLFPYGKELSYYKEYKRAVHDQVSVHFEEYVPPRDIWVSVNAYPTRDGLAIYFTDITEQHLHVNMIEKQNKQLRKIAWIQSHEVRSPLASILGLVQLFDKDDTSNSLNTELIEKISQASIRLDEVIRKITSHTTETKL